MPNAGVLTEAARAGFGKANDRADHELLEFIQKLYRDAIKALGKEAPSEDYDAWVALACGVSVNTIRTRYKPMLKRISMTVDYQIVPDWKKILASLRLRTRQRAASHRAKQLAENEEHD